MVKRHNEDNVIPMANFKRQLLGPDGQPIGQHHARKLEADHFVRTGESTVMPWPAKHMEPEGLMFPSLESAALWNFLQVAHTSRDVIEKQVTLEGDEDTTLSLKTVARQIAESYGVDLESMFHRSVVEPAYLEATRCVLAIDPRVTSFIRTGGQTYGDLDRKPDLGDSS